MIGLDTPKKAVFAISTRFKRVGERLPDLLLVERRLGDVHQHVEDAAGVLVDLQRDVRVVLEAGHVGGAGDLNAVDAARGQVRDQRLGLLQPLEHHLVEVRQILDEVVRVLREARVLVRLPLGHLERPGADRRLLGEGGVGRIVDADGVPVVEQLGDERHRVFRR